MGLTSLQYIASLASSSPTAPPPHPHSGVRRMKRCVQLLVIPPKKKIGLPGTRAFSQITAHYHP